MPGSPELAVIFLLVLVLFGPDRLPQLARQLAKGTREIRKAASDFKNQLRLDD